MGRDIAVALAMTAALEGFGATTARTDAQPRHPAAREALAKFTDVEGRDLDAILRALQRPAPPPAVRAQVVASLPAGGNVEPGEKQARKLEALQPVLALFGRQFDLDIRLFTVGGSAWTGLHERAVLLMTAEAIDLLTTLELVAVVAHDLAHDLVWDAYADAWRRHDTRALQELELWCDGVAVLVLHRLGHDPNHLARALTRLARHNARFKATSDVSRYLPEDQRVELIRAVALLAAGDATRAARHGGGTKR